MQQRLLVYDADGLEMRGQLFYPDSGPAQRWPGVLVFPDARGLGEHALLRARMLAERGFVAFAADLHGDARFLTDLDETFRRLKPLHDDRRKVRVRAQAALKAFVKQPELDEHRLAAIGYCIGGAMALELARAGEDVVGVAGFHAGLKPLDPADARNIKGKVLVCLGSEDPYVPLEDRLAFEEEMRAGGVDWQMNIYGGILHSFTMTGIENFGDPTKNAYDAKADARSWSDLMAFLREIFA